MSLSHVAEMEQYGSSPIDIQILGDFVGTMNDPSVVDIHGLPNCVVLESIWIGFWMVPRML